MLDWRCALERLTPRKLRPLGRFCYAWFTRHGIEREIKRYYQCVPPNDEMREALAFLTKGTLPTFPYPWAYACRAEDVCVSFDEEKKLPYVLMERKRLYFPASWDHDRIRSCFHAVENVDQHPQSPHCYLMENFTVDVDDIVVDGGAAEGNFGLRVVERVKKVYIFEPESYWQEPLQATFAPWKDKVVIVQKYLSKQVFLTLQSMPNVSNQISLVVTLPNHAWRLELNTRSRIIWRGNLLLNF